MRSLIFFTLCLTSYSLHSDQILLDDVMTTQQQREMGINKLSRMQKIRLEQWLNQNFVLKSKNLSQTPTLYLSININNGSQLELSDNSVWEVAPEDRTISSIWITPFPVSITPSGNAAYPFRITNLTSKDSIKAKKLSP